MELGTTGTSWPSFHLLAIQVVLSWTKATEGIITDTIDTFGSNCGSGIPWSMGCWRLPLSSMQSPSSLRVANVETCLFLWEEWERRRGGESVSEETTFPQPKERDGCVGPELWIFPLPLVPQEKKKRQMCFWGVTGSHYSHGPFWSLGRKYLPSSKKNFFLVEAIEKKNVDHNVWLLYF